VTHSGRTAAQEGFRPALMLTAARTVASLFTFAIPVILARHLAPEDFGAYKQIFLIFMTGYGLAQLGMAESLYYFLPLHPERAARLVLNAGTALGAAGLLAAAGLYLGRDLVARLVG
jgi:O-antigen/teichoic acid export membrane protein